MGCGASTGTATVDSDYKFRKVNNPNQGHVSGHHGDQNGVGDPSHKVQHITKETSLPPPRPPDTSLEELLEGKHDLMKKMDKRADNVPFGKSGEQNVQQFTQMSLIPEDTVTSIQVRRAIVEQSGPQKGNGTAKTDEHESNRVTTDDESETDSNSNEESPVPEIVITTPRSAVPPPVLLRQGTQDNMDAADLLLEKHKRDTEQAQKLMEVDRMRHNVTLQDKLAKRREMKRKRDLAQGVVSGVSIGDAAIQAGQQADVQTAAGQVGEFSADAPGSEKPTEESIALGDLTSRAQLEAAQDQHEAVMAEAAPLPVAPETRKEALYGNEDNIELFKDLENFAINMEQLSDPSTTFAILMENLLINQLSDLEKVRILFHWITAQNLNTINFPNNIDEDTPMGFLFAIKHDRKTYAELFCRLCSAAGLHAKVILGYLKGVGYLPDYKFTGLNDAFRGSWNAVLIDGQWRLIDTHWGARHVLEDDDVISTEYKTLYKYEEHYFLTNPDQIVATHYPDENDWQLLSRSFTLEEFQNMVKVWPLFYKLKLQLHNHRTGVIEAPKDGFVEIRLQMSDFACRDAVFKCDFMTKQKQRIVGQNNLACHVFHYVEGEFQVFQVHVPAVGQYLLKIFALSKKFSEDNTFTNVCFYQINCPKLKPSKVTPKIPDDIKPLEIRPPFPEATHPWGPPPVQNIAQLAPVSHSGPIISCDKTGEATLIMQLRGGSKVGFLQQLFEASQGGSTKQSIPDRAVNFTTMAKDGSKMVVFRVRTPKAGVFSLNLYGQTDGSDSFVGFCNYLVVSSIQTKPSPPFPSVPNGALGNCIEECNKLNLVPIVENKYSPKSAGGFLNDFANAWMEPSDKGEAVVTFGHLVPLNILAELQPNNNDINCDVTNCVTLEDTGKRASVIIHPPQYDVIAPEYILKIYAAPTSQSEGIPIIFNSFVTGSKKRAEKLPQPPTKRWGVSNSLPDALLSVAGYHNSEPLFDTDKRGEATDPSPCRLYRGGEDFVMDFSMKNRLTLKASLSIFENGSNLRQLEENNCMLSSIRLTDANLRIRIPLPGEYCLTLYGCHSNDQSGQLSSLMYVRISAVARSSNISLYPRTYGLWSSNVGELFYPLSKNLKRNTVNKIKVFMSSLTQNASASSCEAFPKVLMINDSSSPAYPTKSEDNTHIYEWDYIPGPGEKNVSVVVQKTQGDSSLGYVLQFDVED